MPGIEIARDNRSAHSGGQICCQLQLLLFHCTHLHVLLKQRDRVELSDLLHLEIEPLIIQLISPHCLLYQRYVRSKVDSQFLGNIGDKLEDVLDIGDLRNVRFQNL
jgi:hypothetical protein